EPSLSDRDAAACIAAATVRLSRKFWNSGRYWLPCGVDTSRGASCSCASPGSAPFGLHRYANAPVTAPFPNLPPPATLARPPTVELITRPTKPRPLVRGEASAVTPPARAPGPHLPPDATAEPQPTSARPAAFKR